MDPDFVRIRQAAWLMYGIEHFDDVNLLDATLDDLREFVARPIRSAAELLTQRMRSGGSLLIWRSCRTC